MLLQVSATLHQRISWKKVADLQTSLIATRDQMFRINNVPASIEFLYLLELISSYYYSRYVTIFCLNSDLTKRLRNEKVTTQFFFYASFLLPAPSKCSEILIISISQPLLHFIDVNKIIRSWYCNFNGQQCIFEIDIWQRLHKDRKFQDHKFLRF